MPAHYRVTSPAFHQVSMTVHWYPFIHLGGERHGESKVSCPRTQHNGLTMSCSQTLYRDSSALTIRSLCPLCLSHCLSSFLEKKKLSQFGWKICFSSKWPVTISWTQISLLWHPGIHHVFYHMLLKVLFFSLKYWIVIGSVGKVKNWNTEGDCLSKL